MKVFKMPSAFSVLILGIILMAVLTWIIPSGEFEKNEDGSFIPGSYTQVESSPQGLWDVILAPVYGMLGKEGTDPAIEIALFILVIGGFLGIVEKTGAINSGISTLVKNSRGKEKRLIWILMVLFAIGGSTYGMAEETIAFYPLVIPILMAAGFDTMTALAVVMLGAGTGVLGSTVNPFATGVASQAVGIGLGEGIIWRLLSLVGSVGLAIFYVYRYAMRVKANPQSSLVADQMEENKHAFKIPTNLVQITNKQTVVLGLFVLTFTLMIVSLVPWGSIIPGFTFFESSAEALKQIPFIGSFLGQNMLPFGDWYFVEITGLFLIMAILIGVYYGLSEDDLIKSFISGAASLLSVAFVVVVARGIQVVMNDGQITATILAWFESKLAGMSKGAFAVFSFIMYIPLSLLIPSTSGLAAATMSIMGPLSDFANVPKHAVITGFQAASGIVNMMTPTSGVVIGALAISRVSFDRWLKFSGKLLGMLVLLNAGIIWLAAVFG
ncbi:MAG: YfcC family protein [Spirochaetia bacterium]